MNRFEPVTAPFRTPNLGGPRLGQSASFVEGSVEDAKKGNPIPNALITIRHSEGVTTLRTNSAGQFATGIAVNPGELVEVSASAPGYATRTNPFVVTMPMQGMAAQNFLLEKAISPTLIGAGVVAALGIGYALFG